MKITSVHVLLLLCTAISIFSCRKEITASPNTNLLTERSWTYGQFGIDQNLDGLIDIPQNFETCALDDEIKFNTNGSGSFHQGDNLCYPDVPQSQPLEWKFHNDETQLEYGGTVHTILALDEEQLAIYTEEIDGTSTVRHMVVYNH